MTFLHIYKPKRIYLILLVLIYLAGGCKESAPYFEEGLKNINGAQLYYKILGDGKPVVTVHGGVGLEHSYFLPQMEILSENHRLVFYDQRTSGRSVASTDSLSLSLDIFVEDLEGLRRELGITKMHVLGHSWGGRLAMSYALKYPQKLASLILVGSATAREDSIVGREFVNNIMANLSAQDTLYLSQLAKSESFNNREREAWQQFFKTSFRAYFYNKTLSENLTILFTETTVRNMDIIQSSVLGQELETYNVLDQLHRIECPTLIIHGDADPIPLKYARQIHNKIAGSELFVVEECGHFPFVEKPEIFFDKVDSFWAGL